MQSVSSRIWTRVAVSNSYDDDDYTTGTSQNSFLIYGCMQINMGVFQFFFLIIYFILLTFLLLFRLLHSVSSAWFWKVVQKPFHSIHDANLWICSSFFSGVEIRQRHVEVITNIYQDYKQALDLTSTWYFQHNRSFTSELYHAAASN